MNRVQGLVDFLVTVLFGLISVDEVLSDLFVDHIKKNAGEHQADDGRKGDLPKQVEELIKAGHTGSRSSRASFLLKID